MTPSDLLLLNFTLEAQTAKKLTFVKGKLRLELEKDDSVRLKMSKCSCPFFSATNYTLPELKTLLIGLRL